MANQNGQLILQALQNIDEPATITKIVTHIADTAGVHPNDVKESVQETLNGGVRYGYIQRSNRKYYAAPVELDVQPPVDEGSEPEPEGEKEEQEAGKSDSAAELEDRMRRRKRRSARSRSRRRRASRRRRSRR